MDDCPPPLHPHHPAFFASGMVPFTLHDWIHSCEGRETSSSFRTFRGFSEMILEELRLDYRP